MRTSILDVFAAGDCVEMRLENDDRRKWFQMPLWSQAMHMGVHAAHCMVNSSIELPIEFELFTHATQFFGFKVCLMGLYNGQGMSELHTVSYRRSSETEFVRLILYEGRIVGAVLIGDTGIENTIENLILSEMDVSAYGEYIISPDFDISDYFD
ncbi:Pyridine nucleotide-disulfide oxidoreductase domain-containing protein 1 [Thelohanellus kitauei]|uniref:Pyridine nucleotide-disulfide oxidoreductase domain-containing protein 1 n=1 Tax=Thelohanellus kitauei TaxID=669202 RepID=A0A0C2MXU3_THEKT|nr:Pyridine nucleotide-disulfide oxidoreductase domain-containing protein 1 [Thelohanellus kitauei]